MPHIDYYFATVSPYTYLAGTRMEEVAARHGATIDYRPLDIIQLFGRTGGTPPKDRHPNRMAWRAQELPRQARKAGLPLNIKPAHWPTNPAPSSYAIIAAQDAARGGGGGDLGALVHGFGRACWSEERDIAQDDVVRDVLEEAGFDPALADSGLMTAADTYSRNLEQAVQAGAFGAPFYVTDGGARVWGQDRIDDLDMILAGKL